MRLNELNSDNNTVSLLLYGNTKAGKTFFIGSAGDRAVIISPAQGIATLQSALFKHLIKANPVIEIVDEEPLPDSASGYDKVQRLLEQYLDDKDIDTIIVDDATNFRRMAMNKGLELNNKLLSGSGAPRSNTLKKMKSMSSNAVIGKEIADWTAEMALVESFINNATMFCKQAGKNFILTAHERLTFKSVSKIGDIPEISKIAPGFSGRTFPDDVSGFFDLIWHAEVAGSGDRTFYQIRTQGSSSVVAGTRWGGLFPVMFEKQPTFLEVIECVRTQKPYTTKK